MSLTFRNIALRHGEKHHKDLVALQTRAMKYASPNDIRIFSICVDLPPQELKEIEALRDVPEESKRGSHTHGFISMENTEANDDDDTSYPGSDQGEPAGNAVPWHRLREVNYRRLAPLTQDDANTNVSHTVTDDEGDVAMKEDDSDDRGSSTSTSDARDDPDYQNWIDEDTPMPNAPDSSLGDSSTNDIDVSDAVQKWLHNTRGTPISTEEMPLAASARDADPALPNDVQHSPTSGDITSEFKSSDTFDIFEDEADPLGNPTNGEAASSSMQLCSTTVQSHSNDDRDAGDDYWPERLKRKLDKAEAKYKDYIRQRVIFGRDIATKAERTGKIDDSALCEFVRNNVAHPPKVSVRELLALKDCIEDVVDFNYDGKRNLNEINREAHKRKALRYEPPGSTKRFRSKCLGSSLRFVIGIDQEWGDEDN
ncbi:hypothetical protein ACHAPQ_002213 [Fusarium lateritium]